MAGSGKKIAIVLILGVFGFGAAGYSLFTSESGLYGPAGTVPAPALNLKLIQILSHLTAGLKDLETAELGFAFTADNSFRTAHDNIREGLRRSIGELRTVAAGELPTVKQVEKLVDRRLEFSDRIAAGRTPKLRAVLVRSPEPKRLVQEINVLLSRMEQNALKESMVRRREGAETGGTPAGTVARYGAGLSIVLLCGLIIVWELSHSHESDRGMHELSERLTLFSDNVRDAAHIMLAPDGAITFWDRHAERVLGYPGAEVLGRHFSVGFSDEDIRAGRPEACLRTAEDKGSCELSGDRQRKDGSLFRAQCIITALRGANGGVRSYFVVVRDVTEQQKTEELLKKLSLSVEQTADLVMISDSAGKLEFVNASVEEVSGFTREELLHGGVGMLFDCAEKTLFHRLLRTALTGRPCQAEVNAVGKNGRRIFLDQCITPIKDASGRVDHLVFTGSDLTPVKQMRDKLDYLQSYDSLTGLPNRHLFAKRLDRELTSDTAIRKPMAVLAVDIDRFKYLNEIYGLEAGNSVLKQVAENLSVFVNKGDTVARLGSDEFGMVLHDVGKPADVVLFIKMIMKNVPQIVMSGGKEISVTLSVGIGMYPADGTDALTLMKNADTALSKAKGLGRNHYQFYRSDMNEGISELVFMERRLTSALKNKEYTVAYQPYYHLVTRKVAGAEALLRWNNDEFGKVSPSKFIPMLEETGMITDVGSWVLRTACSQLKAWTNGKSHLPISVNLSPTQFRHEYLVENVGSTVREFGIDPKRLVLEVTESVFMKDHDFAISVLQRLKNIGVSISIDDFGTGYSSLSYLKKFPVDMIKIDQSFVRDVASDPDTTSLVTAIIAMAHALGLSAIAEGVETEEQWKVLRLLKCDMGQGYYFSLAVGPKEFERLVG